MKVSHTSIFLARLLRELLAALKYLIFVLFAAQQSYVREIFLYRRQSNVRLREVGSWRKQKIELDNAPFQKQVIPIIH